MKQQYLELGKVVNTHGIRGEIKIQPWCDDPNLFDQLSYFYIDGVRYEIKKNRLHKNCEIVLVEGITNINQAELLKNKIVTIEREMLGALPEGTYYIADLIGLSVRTKDGQTLGNIVDVLKTGSNDVYILDKPKEKPILIPVIDQVVKEVNIDGGFVTVELMEGLID
ncbi:ribosome maturation factor RimM [Ructibacterium gallinarum]|uniref:Ribosome maturation factor RimM n=1 Tax=Ructibacterium gallinarum TaxID=2779355 RepID=A0A9D5M405_9FIRM|nr:ribosome maturation factor RimM [Ructibacterium gallinarum]MBE5040289.1 ribosome maturation factor RimM [Ructibacterium gallinarum]